jgi:hypothetical protein
MKRRYFLLSGLAGICGISAWRFAASSEQAAIAKVLQKRLSYLALDPAGVQQFCRDLSATGVISSGRLRLIDALGPIYTLPALSADNKMDNSIRHGEDRVVTLYLLSTDFFKNGADVNRTVSYVRYYDPMIACGNPFARPVIVPTTA